MDTPTPSSRQYRGQYLEIARYFHTLLLKPVFKPRRGGDVGHGPVTAASYGKVEPMDSNRYAPAAPTVVDVFSGAGGLAEGFRQAGFHVLLGIDSDPDACATFKLNFPTAQSICGDIRIGAIRRCVLEVAKTADVIVGGPPCQAFSQVRNNTRYIEDPRNSLYKEFVSIVRGALPAAFLMENVTGIDQMGLREQIAADLELDGEYSVLPQVVDAADVGVPQTRKRLLFVGVRRSLGIAAPRIAHTGATRLVSLVRRDVRGRISYELDGSLLVPLADPEDVSAVTAWQAISDLEGVPDGLRSDTARYDLIGPPRSAYQREMRRDAGDTLHNIQQPRLRDDTRLRLNGIPPGGNYRDLPEELAVRNITGEKWGPESGSGLLARRHYYAYRKLHPEIWSWTLNTKADSVYHYSLGRSLSVREFARIHSFPDRFVFTTDPRKGAIDGRHEGGAAHSRFRQVGNAVPPLLARACAAALLRCVSAPAVAEPIAA